MTGTTGFLNMQDRRKECQKQRQEECVIQRFVELGAQKCGCTPWGLASALPNTVSTLKSDFYDLFIRAWISAFPGVTTVTEVLQAAIMVVALPAGKVVPPM